MHCQQTEGFFFFFFTMQDQVMIIANTYFESCSIRLLIFLFTRKQHVKFDNDLMYLLHQH